MKIKLTSLELNPCYHYVNAFKVDIKDFEFEGTQTEYQQIISSLVKGNGSRLDYIKSKLKNILSMLQGITPSKDIMIEHINDCLRE